MAGVYSVRGDEPIFSVEKTANVLVLQLVPDPSVSNYRSKQFEYNRMVQEINSSEEVEHLLFDLSECGFVDSVTISILVSLTLHMQDYDGIAAMCCCTPEVGQTLNRLMMLEPDNKRATWANYPSRRHAIEALQCETN